MPSNIPRCPHGVYDPHGDGYGCQFCNIASNHGSKAEAKKFVMPAKTLSEQNGHVYSNKHSPGHCPECGSGIHTVERPGLWRCAECATEYNAPRARGVAE